MAISFVDHAEAATTSVALPAGLAASDIILIFAFRGVLTAPSLPAGYTNIFSQSANTISFRLGYKIAVGGDTSGTWTNADFIQALVYRGASGVGGAGSGTNAAAGTTTIPGIGTFTVTNGTSWAVSFGGSLQIVSMSTPASSTLRSTQTATIDMGIGIDSNTGVSSWGQKLSTNGLSAAGGGGSVELIATAAAATTAESTLLMMGV